ncbi:ALQxL family class IV lanthipeptide [Sphaerisporangium dianthi]|uniref:ALQxL family class IV lanthipeptide n=1 Tax=Sphaerisporangium dianthi TaxID=1436120 RepID=A0ABV9CUL8_9ACTN
MEIDVNALQALPESQPRSGRWPCWETIPCCYSVTGDTNA